MVSWGQKKSYHPDYPPTRMWKLHSVQPLGVLDVVQQPDEDAVPDPGGPAELDVEGGQEDVLVLRQLDEVLRAPFLSSIFQRLAINLNWLYKLNV